MKRLLLLFIPISLFGQNSSFTSGARSTGLAHSSVTLSDVWSAFNNQAGIAEIENPTIGAGYQNRYFLKELVTANAAVAYPLNRSALGLQMEYYGFDLFNRSKIGLCYARSFGTKFSFGLSINYEMFHIEQGTNNSGTATLELGIRTKPIEGLICAFHIYNPTNSHLNNEAEEILPIIARFGVQKNFSEGSLIVVEARQQENFSTRYSVGFEYAFDKVIGLRTGISTYPFSYTWGIKLPLSKFSFDLGYEYSPELQSSANVSLNCTL